MIISPGELRRRAKQASELYRPCQVCPRECGVDRISGETGICGETSEIRIAAAAPHFGEEPPLTGKNGVGNIFISGCNLSCVYCQNYQASQEGIGDVFSSEEIAPKMLEFQRMGVESVGWVTPSHAVPGMMNALAMAVERGFSLPLIYNTNSYDRVDTLRFLSGIADVYLADLRYSDNEKAIKYSGAEDYVELSRAAVEEMFRQVGPFRGSAGSSDFGGLIIRILVLPDDFAGVWETLCFIALELSPKIPISLMSQYRPLHRASEYPNLNRCITEIEYGEALRMAEELGFETIYTQELNPEKHLTPDFNRKGDPFKKGA